MASILKVDDLRGNTAAGDITVTDGSATMKLQKGVAKAFHGFGNQTTGALNASSETLNISSYEDVSTGTSALNITNAMAVSTVYSVIGSTQSYDYQNFAASSTKYRNANVNSSGNVADGVTHGVIFGDLA